MNFTITLSDYKAVESQALIVDVRDPEEHQTLFKLPNSLNIPYLKLIIDPEKYFKDKNKIIITYCNFGNRSGKAANFLREKGYSKAFVLEKGINRLSPDQSE